MPALRGSAIVKIVTVCHVKNDKTYSRWSNEKTYVTPVRPLPFVTSESILKIELDFPED